MQCLRQSQQTEACVKSTQTLQSTVDNVTRVTAVVSTVKIFNFKHPSLRADLVEDSFDPDPRTWQGEAGRSDIQRSFFARLCSAMLGSPRPTFRGLMTSIRLCF